MARRGCFRDLRKKLTDTLHYIASLGFIELRIYGQRKRFLRRTFALREASLALAEIREALLKMHGDRIIDFRGHTFLLKSAFQLIPACRMNDILVEYVAIRRNLWKVEIHLSIGDSGETILREEGTVGNLEAGLGKEPVITRSIPLACGRPVVQMPEFDRDDCSLQ